MAEGYARKPPSRRPDRLLFLLIILALIVVWGLAISYASFERTIELDQAKSRLAATVSSLADFSELAEKSATKTPNEMTEERTNAIWRALLQYPTASIWVESSVESSTVSRPPANWDRMSSSKNSGPISSSAPLCPRPTC